MSEQSDPTQTHTSGWWLKLALVLFILSIVLPLVGIPGIVAPGLSATKIASVSGALLMAAEVIGVLAVSSGTRYVLYIIYDAELGFTQK